MKTRRGNLPCRTCPLRHRRRKEVGALGLGNRVDLGLRVLLGHSIRCHGCIFCEHFAI